MGSLIRDEPYSWKCDSSVGGGALNTVGSHLVDLLTFATRSRVKRVQGSLKTFRSQTPAVHRFRRVSSDDYCSFQAELDNQAFATVTINTHAIGHVLARLGVGHVLIELRDLPDHRPIIVAISMRESQKSQSSISEFFARRYIDGGAVARERGEPAGHRGDHQLHQRERGSHRTPQGNL